MSSVAFHTADRTVKLGSTERAYMDWLCDKVTFGVLDIQNYPRGDDSTFRRLLRMVPTEHYLHNLRSIDEQVLSMPPAISHGQALHWNDHPVNAFELSLNTALVLGGDALKLSARIHGSCEIHGYITGENRWWVADIIERGQRVGVLRDAYQVQYGNWPAVLQLLRESRRDHVVMSYSVTDSFPPWDHERDSQKNWDEAVSDLTSLDNGLEICPETWDTHYYGAGLTALDLTAPDWTARLDRLYPKENK